MSTASNELSPAIQSVKLSPMAAEQIPLSKLSAWKGNVRKTAITDSLEELKASILAHGVLVPLIVQKGDKNSHKVIAGQRRLAALKALFKDGEIEPDHPVPCVVAASDIDATEVSLTENVVRSQMHPADQFEAFRNLIDKGSSIADVAARFGISERTVIKLMKLGRVSPRLLNLYRKGEMDMEAVQAFTLTDDHSAQENYWKQAKGWQCEAGAIREALTKGEVKATDNRVRFVGGIEVYEAAGGTVRRDLFDDQNAGYVTNLPLLAELVAAKLEGVAAEVRAEGWKWVEIMPQFDWSEARGYDMVHGEEPPLTPEQEKRLSELSEEQDELTALGEQQGLTIEQEAQFDSIQAEIDSLEDRPEIYRSEVIAKAGAFISIGYRGEPEIRRGYVKPEDQREAGAETVAVRTAKEKPAAEETGIPASLIEDLTAQRTVAMRIELAKQPSLALSLTVYTLACAASHSARSCLKLSVQQTFLNPLIKHPEESSALTEYLTDSPLIDALPTEEGALWQYCLEASDEHLLALLAVLVSHGIDAVDYKSGSKSVPHADRLADSLALDMKEHFKPTAENYFSRLPKAEIIKAMVEIDGGEPVSPATEKLKKSALAKMAEDAHRASASGWLPVPLRSGPPEIERETDELDDAA